MADMPLTERVQAAMQTLLDGTQDERQDLLDTLERFEAADRTQLKAEIILALERLQEYDYRLTDPKTAPTVRGWLVGALAAMGPLDDESQELLVQRALHDDSEWVRYWSLAHLYLSGSPVAGVLAETIPQSSTVLVRRLAEAIAAKVHRPDHLHDLVVKWLQAQPERQLWSVLRALQIVAVPEAVPDLLGLLDEEASDSIVYDVLLSLTAPGMGDAGAAAIRDRIDAERLTSLVLRASRHAPVHKVRRFSSVLRVFDRAQVIDAILRIGSAGSPDEHAAKVLLAQLDYTPLTVPPGKWRAEFAYYTVLRQPARFEMLETLDVGDAYRAAAQPDASVDDIVARARSDAHGAEPNKLWAAWIETVHAHRTQQS